MKEKVKANDNPTLCAIKFIAIYTLWYLVIQIYKKT